MVVLSKLDSVLSQYAIPRKALYKHGVSKSTVSRSVGEGVSTGKANTIIVALNKEVSERLGEGAVRVTPEMVGVLPVTELSKPREGGVANQHQTDLEPTSVNERASIPSASAVNHRQKRMEVVGMTIIALTLFTFVAFVIVARSTTGSSEIDSDFDQYLSQLEALDEAIDGLAVHATESSLSFKFERAEIRQEDMERLLGVVTSYYKGNVNSATFLACDFTPGSMRGWRQTRVSVLYIERCDFYDQMFSDLGSVINLTCMGNGTKRAPYAFTDADAKLVSKSALQYLDVGDSKVTAEGLRHLKEAVQLSHISVIQCDIGDDAVPIFLSMPELKSVNLRGAKMTEAGYRKLRAAGIDVDR